MCRYSREDILNIRPKCPNLFNPAVIADETTWRLVRRRTKRGCRSGVKERARRRGHKPSLPTIVFGNAQSLRNKPDELEASVRFRHEFREACLLCFSETWFSDKDTDPQLPGFTLARMDRSKKVTGKKTGGGVCVFVNNRWCRNITIKEQLCTPDLELLSVGLRPFYLPREFHQVFVTVVYIHPRANAKCAADVIWRVMQGQESECPESIRLVMGDFNHCRLSKVLPQYRQYVNCKTCGDATLDQCFGNIPRAYRSRPMPSLGRSVHDLVHLLPLYRQKLKTSKPSIRQVKVWSREAIETLDTCFHCTDWDTLLEGASLDEQVDVVTSYIGFCIDMIVPSKQVRSYPNNKPWVTKEVGDILRQRQQAFQEGNKEEVKRLQKEMRKTVLANKRRFKDKVESNLASSNSRLVWSGLQTMTGYKPGKKGLDAEDLQKLSQDLNTFYGRFDTIDFSAERKSTLEELNGRDLGEEVLTDEEVGRRFQQVNPRSACGPDELPGAVLKHCHDSLATVFRVLFQHSLDSGHIPSIWKSSTIIPIPKKPSPTTLNDYRPVALTSIPFKCLEKIVLSRLLGATRPFQDPLQFAYSPNRSTEDAINTVVHTVLHHLERPGTYARLLFLDFSSAFNTIQPHLMMRKLMVMDVNPRIIRWLCSFLTDRPQRVMIKTSTSTITSGEIRTNTGAPQGCVLSPALFTLYTSDCRCVTESTLQVKFSDDTSLTGLISTSENDYRSAVDRLVGWCDDNYLLLNVAKTKEVVVDFRRHQTKPTPLVIKGGEVELVDQYKYLGSIIDSKLNWSANAQALLKKGNQRLFFVRRLNSFGVGPRLLELFYRATVESVLTFNSLCFFSSLKEHDKGRLTKIITTAGKVIGRPVTDLQTLFEEKAIRRLKAIQQDPSHPLCNTVLAQVSARSGRLVSFRARTDRFRNSFLPTAVRLTNNKT